jgi:hypothetical protein
MNTSRQQSTVPDEPMKIIRQKWRGKKKTKSKKDRGKYPKGNFCFTFTSKNPYVDQKEKYKTHQ